MLQGMNIQETRRELHLGDVEYLVFESACSHQNSKKRLLPDLFMNFY